MTYDVYLAHASENTQAARALADALMQRGLTVWFNRFLVGPSIREQMEHGLRQSDFGIVMLSPEFFAKKWTRHELDALLGLEEPGEVRILPVWWETTEAQVREHSPMLAMRSAAVLGGGGVEGVAEALVESVVSLSWYRSPAKRVRSQIATGFRWDHPPVWAAASLAEYDRSFADEYGFSELAYHPDVTARQPGQLVPLMELLRAYAFWDGKRVSTIGWQLPGSVQVFEELASDNELPPDPSRPAGAGVAAYVFQLTSRDFERGELCYVHCIGPYDPGTPGMGPNSPDGDWLCLVTGLVLAFGHMPNTRKESVPAAYLAASSIMFMPAMDGTGDGDESGSKS